MENEDFQNWENFLDEDDAYRVWLDEQYQSLLEEYEGMVINEEHEELHKQYC